MAGSPFLISSYSVALWVRKVFSSTLLPGFSGLASSVLHADLPPSAPYPLRLYRLIRFGFFFLLPIGNVSWSRAGGFPWVRLYNLPTYRPPAYRFDSPDIGSRLFTTARSSPRSHIGGSLFATYAVLPHASSPRGVSAHAVALLVWSFRPVTADSFTSDATHQNIGCSAMPGTRIF